MATPEQTTSKDDRSTASTASTAPKRRPEPRTDLVPVEFSNGYVAMVTPVVAESFRKKLEQPQHSQLRVVRVGK